MEYLARATDGEWTPIVAPEGAPQEQRDKASAARAALTRFTVDSMISGNVVVLTGLGTSLCVSAADGTRVAPTMADLWAAAQGQAENFAHVLEHARYDPAASGENLERLLSNCQLVSALGPDDVVDQFVRLAEGVITQRCSFVRDELTLDVHEAFLRRLARRPISQPRAKVFTVNYDLCFEAAANRSRFVVIDGFSHTHPQEFGPEFFAYDLVRREDESRSVEYISNVFHLYKLHGSVDWAYDGTTRVVRDSSADRRRALIYPRYGKFEASYQPPFLEMLSRFQSAIRQPNTALIVIGFGFGDVHIVQPVLAAVRANVGLRVLIVDPNIPDGATPTGTLMSLVRGGDERIALAKMQFEQFVPLLPELVPTSESEQHEARVRQSA